MPLCVRFHPPNDVIIPVRINPIIDATNAKTAILNLFSRIRHHGIFRHELWSVECNF